MNWDRVYRTKYVNKNPYYGELKKWQDHFSKSLVEVLTISKEQLRRDYYSPMLKQNMVAIGNTLTIYDGKRRKGIQIWQRHLALLKNNIKKYENPKSAQEREHEWLAKVPIQLI